MWAWTCLLHLLYKCVFKWLSWCLFKCCLISVFAMGCRKRDHTFVCWRRGVMRSGIVFSFEPVSGCSGIRSAHIWFGRWTKIAWVQADISRLQFVLQPTHFAIHSETTALVGNGHKGDMRWIIFVDSWFRNPATWDVHNMIHINIILSSDSLTHDQLRIGAQFSLNLQRQSHGVMIG